MQKHRYSLDDLFLTAKEAADSLLSQTSIYPQTAVVLGSGIKVLENLDDATSIPYQQICSFPQTTVKGHSGVVTVGKCQEIPIAIFRGRFHRYEGHPWSQVVFPVTLMHALGIKNVIMTNSAGGLNQFFTPGDLMLIRDHIYWQFPATDEQAYIYQLVGNRQQPHYSPKLAEAARAASLDAQILLHNGIYASLTGPTYETAGEVHLLTYAARCDAMGMSTVPEVIWASCLGLEVMGISCITNVATSPQSLAATSHEEVVAVAKASSQKLDRLLQNLLPRI